MNLSELNRAKVMVRWNRIYREEREIIRKNAKSTKHLKARIHAYLCGDGSVSRRYEKGTGKLHHEIRFYPDHLSMAESFNEAAVKVYGRAFPIAPLKNHYRLMVCSRAIAEDLLTDGPFSSLKWKVPSWVMKSRRYSWE